MDTYIDSAFADESDIRREVEFLLRSETAFAARFAGELAIFRDRFQNGEANSVNYKSQTQEQEDLIDHAPGTIGASFAIAYGQKSLHSKSHLLRGNSPVISSSGENNGCYGFFDFDTLIKPPFTTVPSTGSIGQAFVQTLPCGVSDDCLLLFARPGTPIEALYVAAAVVRLERWRFSYGRKATPERISTFKLPINDNLIDWIREKRAAASRLSSMIIDTLNGDEQARVLFERLAREWRAARTPTSSASRMAAHPAYLRIIGMGARAVPFILRELKERPDHWFAALHAITGASPVPEHARGRLAQMADAWVEWGRENGFP